MFENAPSLAVWRYSFCICPYKLDLIQMYNLIFDGNWFENEFIILFFWITLYTCGVVSFYDITKWCCLWSDVVCRSTSASMKCHTHIAQSAYNVYWEFEIECIHIFFSHLEPGIANTRSHFPRLDINVANLCAPHNHHLYQRNVSVDCVQKTHFRHSFHFSPQNLFRICESRFMQKNTFILYRRRLKISTKRKRETGGEGAWAHTETVSVVEPTLTRVGNAFYGHSYFLVCFLFCVFIRHLYALFIGLRTPSRSHTNSQ